MALSKVHIKQLAGITGITGVICGSIALYIQGRADDGFNKHPLVTEAKNLLERNDKALDLIGRPVKYPGGVACRIETNHDKSRTLHMTIPFWAANVEGHLKLDAFTDPTINDWSLYSLKAQIDRSTKGQQIPVNSLLIYKLKNQRVE